MFLGARLPLTKTFSMRQGQVTASPYPQIARVTSYHEQANTLAELHILLVDHAKREHCLFNGQLQHPLKDESRAGKTQKELQHFIVFDFDKVQGTSHEDVVARYLPEHCQNVAYIAQRSASMSHPQRKPGIWSGHIFMLLKTPATEVQLKQYIEWVNFNVKALTNQISLSDSQQALHWPLDRTSGYASKLIYIAPPKCYGFQAPTEPHFTLVKKRQTHLTLPTVTPLDGMTVRNKINELRRAVGLDEITYDVTPFQDFDVLSTSSVVEVHGIRTSGDHYIRFNLNGGDSYAYYIDLRNPALIRNFKGEPFLKTEDAAPDLWKALRAKAPKIVAQPPLDEATDVLAFYATNQASSVKIGTYSAITQHVDLNPATETSAKAWLATFGLPTNGYLAHIDITFDPRVNTPPYIHGDTHLNTFQLSPYMARARSKPESSTLAEVPKLVDKIMRSMLGNPTDEIYFHFVNWLASIFQTREKTGTAWVLHGVEGTGKGSFVKYVLKPIFGHDYVRVIQFGQAMSGFNAFLEQALFVVFEEADMKAVENNAELMAKLRHWITDSPIDINQKNVKTYAAENYSNFFLFSNERTPVIVSNGNRRFNIAERQETRLFFTPNELQLLREGDALETFADVLQRWPVNSMLVSKLIETKATADMHEASTSVNQLIAEAVLKGDLNFFIDRMPSDAESAADFFNRFNPLGGYKQLLDRYASEAAEGQESLVTEADLFILFRTLIPDNRYFQDSKTWRKRHYKTLGLEVDKRVRVPGSWKDRNYGVLVRWKAEQTPTLPNNVTEIKKGRKK